MSLHRASADDGVSVPGRPPPYRHQCRLEAVEGPARPVSPACSPAGRRRRRTTRSRRLITAGRTGIVSQVGVTGFEPATSWSRTKRSSQAELHPASLELPPALIRICSPPVRPVRHIGVRAYRMPVSRRTFEGPRRSRPPDIASSPPVPPAELALSQPAGRFPPLPSRFSDEADGAGRMSQPGAGCHDLQNGGLPPVASCPSRAAAGPRRR